MAATSHDGGMVLLEGAGVAPIVQNPKTEEPKSEIGWAHWCDDFGLRCSAFFRASDFGFRILIILLRQASHLSRSNRLMRVGTVQGSKAKGQCLEIVAS